MGFHCVTVSLQTLWHLLLLTLTHVAAPHLSHGVTSKASCKGETLPESIIWYDACYTDHFELVTFRCGVFLTERAWEGFSPNRQYELTPSGQNVKYTRICYLKCKQMVKLLRCSIYHMKNEGVIRSNKFYVWTSNSNSSDMASRYNRFGNKCTGQKYWTLKSRYHLNILNIYSTSSIYCSNRPQHIHNF